MATAVKRRAGTSYEHLSFTGAPAETTVDLDKNTVVVHDGSTQGGFPLAREDMSNVDPDVIGGMLDLNTIGAATAAQGQLAETAIQPGDTEAISEPMLSNDVAAKLNDTLPNNFDATTSPSSDDDGADTAGNGVFERGSIWYDTSSNNLWQCVDNTTGSAMWTKINLQVGDLGTAAIKNVEDFATPLQGMKADSALQPSANISELTNDAGYIAETEAPVQSVAGKTGHVVIEWNNLQSRPDDFPDLGSFSVSDIDKPFPSDPSAADKFAVIIDHPDYAPNQIVVRSDGTNWRYVATIGAVVSV